MSDERVAQASGQDAHGNAKYGENRETAGGTRFNAGKPGGYWKLPLYGLRAVARVGEYGAQKYAPRDWDEGQSFSTLLDSAFRHFLEVIRHGPLAVDPETRTQDNPDGVFHVAEIVWNLLCILDFIEQERREEVDDVSGWYGVTTAQKEWAEAMAEEYGLSVVGILEEFKEYEERKFLEALFGDGVAQEEE